jgi:hypothetical protein
MEGDKQGGGDYGTFQGPPSGLSSEPYARHRGAYQVSFAVNFVLNSNWIGGYTHELIIWVSSLPFFLKSVLIIKKRIFWSLPAHELIKVEINTQN